MNKHISRREFLKVAGIGLGAIALGPQITARPLAAFPEYKLLGRVVEGKVDVRARPDVNSQSVGALYEDAVVPWLREVVGYNPYRYNQRWVETPDGYIWSPLLQPVRDEPNTPITLLPRTSLGPGMWVMVTVPFLDVVLENPPARTTPFVLRAEQNLPPRLYYSQVFWVDTIEIDELGQVWYRVYERFGPGEKLWGQAEAFRILSREEVTPISTEVENKRIDVNLTRQTVSLYEDEREVYFARVSTGLPGTDTETPPGQWHRVWRKMISTHMAGGTNAAGWDLPGIGFTTLFVGSGVAFHSTFWHNNFGEEMSRGCVNLSPEAAQHIFRWCLPLVEYDPGDMTVSGMDGNLIRVLEA